MHTRWAPPIFLALGLLAGCDGTDSASRPSTEPDPNPQIDTDITPHSGSGGESQAVSPDGTTSSKQKPAATQPSPAAN